MSLFRMAEGNGLIYIVPMDVYDFVTKMHPDCFKNGEMRAMANAYLVIDKKSAKVIKARSFNPNGNDH
ncbi:hypothetical protein SEA_BILLNYE_162 [Streptomyces phage BillNye]|uniref:Uncharacterized protein n=2 Tax=Wilnyevirus billnye TaxID=2560486 RepID=A0A2L1IW23_9CAUD|nr:hypothetical protein FDJ30_gp098 [Streptomyces phage BillNye]AVD99335.1 hypothetical protein SEA_BILLNYE_162 [Streptomyces phage BillNye]QBZ72418.1 hypothetical protein SEA_CIRCINUS_163 [Streptomyces phage Circinus]